MAQYFYSATGGELLSKLSYIQGAGSISTAYDSGIYAVLFDFPASDTIFRIEGIPASKDLDIVYKRRTVAANAGVQLGAGKLMAGTRVFCSIGYYDGTGLVRVLGTNRTNLSLGGGLVTNAEVYHLIRIRITDNGDNTSTIRVRAWNDGATEPTTWAIERTDGTADYHEVGYPCFYSDNSQDNYVQWIGVGTDGDSGPTSPVVPSDPQLSSTISSEFSYVANLGIKTAINLAGTLEQSNEVIGSITTGLPLQGSLSQDAAITANLIYTKRFQVLLEQSSFIQADLAKRSRLQCLLTTQTEVLSSLQVGQGLQTTLQQDTTVSGKLVVASELSCVLEQQAEVSASLRLGVLFESSVYTDSVVSGALGLAVHLIGGVDQTNADIAVVGPHIGVHIEGTIQTPTTITATLKKESGVQLQAEISTEPQLLSALSGAVLGGYVVNLEQAQSLFAALKISTPLSQTELEQTSEILAGFPSKLHLSTGLIGTNSTLAAHLITPVRMLVDLTQFQSVAALSLKTDKRLVCSVEQYSEILLPLKGLNFVGQMQTEIDTEVSFAASLKKGVRLFANITQNGSFLADGDVTTQLKFLPIQQASKFWITLRVPALGSTGWLTVSDIVFHNDYYSEVIFEKISASEISMIPAVHLDSISVQPE